MSVKFPEDKEHTVIKDYSTEFSRIIADLVIL